MSEYVIKNCDNYTNFDEDWTCRSTIQNRKGCYCCKNITDCLLKQIVKQAGYCLCPEILELLDIEEVE